jgi:hypothetical protein
MDTRIFRPLGMIVSLFFPTSFLKSQPALDPLLRNPSRAEWNSLKRFNQTLTRARFQERLRDVFDPFHGLEPFLQITDNSVKVLAAPGGDELVEVNFASSPEKVKPSPVAFRSPSEIPRHPASKPLAGIRLPTLSVQFFTNGGVTPSRQ